MKRLISLFFIPIIFSAWALPTNAVEIRKSWDLSKLTDLNPDQTRYVFGYLPLTTVMDDYSFTAQVGPIKNFQAVLMPCDQVKTEDKNYRACIEEVSYRKTGRTSWELATLSEFSLSSATSEMSRGVYQVGPISYDPQTTQPDGDRSSIWLMKNALHTGGANYLVRARFLGGTGNQLKFRMKLEVLPISFPRSSKSLSQSELTVEEFPEDHEYRVKLRLGVYVKTITGWFFGRLQDPYIDRNGPLGYIEFAGKPARVPIGITETFSAAEADKFHDPEWCDTFKRNKKQTFCSNGNIFGRKAFTFTSFEGWKPSELPRWERAPGGVKTVATLTYWSVDSSYFNDQEYLDKSAEKCATSIYGANARIFHGAVFSNSTMFQTAPPQWDSENSSFVFQVAAPHLDENGMPNRGFYSLYIPIELAKCRWGEIASNSRAEVQILSENGRESISTSSVKVENGNLKFYVDGFGYSSPTIKIKLVNSQVQNLQPVKIANSEKLQLTITCKKGKLERQIKGTKPKCPKGFKLKN